MRVRRFSFEETLIDSGQSRDKPGGRGVWRLAQVVLTIAVTWFVVRQVGVGLDDLRALGADWWRPRWGLFLAASFAMAIGILGSAALWGLLVQELSGVRIAPLRATRIFVTANLARYIPGKVWQIAGLAVMAKQEGVGPVVATAAAVLGQLIALGAASILGAGVLLSSGGDLAVWGWVAIGMVGLGVGLASVPAIGERLVGFWFRLARVATPETLRPGRTFAVRWLLLYLANWGVYAGAFWMFARSFDVNGSVMELGGAFAAAYVIGYLAVFAPAGLGVRESFLVVFLGPVAGPGPAAALAVASRVWTTAVEVGAALLAVAVAPGPSPVTPGGPA